MNSVRKIQEKLIIIYLFLVNLRNTIENDARIDISSSSYAKDLRTLQKKQDSVGLKRLFPVLNLPCEKIENVVHVDVASY